MDSLKDSFTARAEPVGSSILTRNMLRSSVGMNSLGTTSTSKPLPANTTTATRTVSARCLSAAPNIFRYAPSMPARKRSMARPTGPLPVCVRKNRDDIMGVRVKATNSDTDTANATVRPNCTKKRPMMPFMVATGTNTAKIDAVSNTRRQQRQ